MESIKTEVDQFVTFFVKDLLTNLRVYGNITINYALIKRVALRKYIEGSCYYYFP